MKELKEIKPGITKMLIEEHLRDFVNDLENYIIGCKSEEYVKSVIVSLMKDRGLEQK